MDDKGYVDYKLSGSDDSEILCSGCGVYSVIIIIAFLVTVLTECILIALLYVLGLIIAFLSFAECSY